MVATSSRQRQPKSYGVCSVPSLTARRFPRPPSLGNGQPRDAWLEFETPWAGRSGIDDQAVARSLDEWLVRMAVDDDVRLVRRQQTSGRRAPSS